MAASPAPMAADGTLEAPKARNRGSMPGYEWVSSSPSPAVVAELESRFPDVVQIPIAKLEMSSACWNEKAILARSFHWWVPPEAFIREFRRAGISGDIQPVCLPRRRYIFWFDDSAAKEMVLARPWVVNGQPVATERWRPEFIPAMTLFPRPSTGCVCLLFPWSFGTTQCWKLCWRRRVSFSSLTLLPNYCPEGRSLEPAFELIFATLCVRELEFRGWVPPSGSNSSSSILLEFALAVGCYISLAPVLRRPHLLILSSLPPAPNLALGCRPYAIGSPLVRCGRRPHKTLGSPQLHLSLSPL